MVVDRDGGLYFTDPTWGVAEADRQLDFKGIYYLPPGGRTDDLVLVGKQNWPNGLGLLPDGRLLVANEQEPLGWYLYTRTPRCGGPPSWTQAEVSPPIGPLTPPLGPPEPPADRRGNDGLHVDAPGGAPPVVYATGYRGLWVMVPPTVGRTWWVSCVLPPPPAVAAAAKKRQQLPCSTLLQSPADTAGWAPVATSSENHYVTHVTSTVKTIAKCIVVTVYPQAPGGSDGP